MARSRFVYVSYIRTTPETLWSVLTDAKLIPQYWFGNRMESAWTAGAPWRNVYPDGRVTDVGEIAEAVPPHRLAIRWRHQDKADLGAEGESLCTMEIERSGTAAKLTLTHTIEREPSQLIAAVSVGWPKVISNLKSLLETGAPALADPYPAPSALVREPEAVS